MCRPPAPSNVDLSPAVSPYALRSHIRIGNESVPKVIINDTMKCFSETALSILVISNHNSFRVLFDKIAFVYFI